MVELSTADRMVPGSNPGASFLLSLAMIARCRTFLHQGVRGLDALACCTTASRRSTPSSARIPGHGPCTSYTRRGMIASAVRAYGRVPYALVHATRRADAEQFACV